MEQINVGVIIGSRVRIELETLAIANGASRECPHLGTGKVLTINRERLAEVRLDRIFKGEEKMWVPMWLLVPESSPVTSVPLELPKRKRSFRFESTSRMSAVERGLMILLVADFFPALAPGHGRGISYARFGERRNRKPDCGVQNCNAGSDNSAHLRGAQKNAEEHLADRQMFQ